MLHLLKGPILRISVSCDDHSYLIGKSGFNHKRLQASSKALIHFPDLKDQARSASSENVGNCVGMFQDPDEVLVNPAQIDLKKEPCSAEMDGRLFEVFSFTISSIRSNQPLVVKVPFECPPEFWSTVQQEVHQIEAMAVAKSLSLSLESVGDIHRPLFVLNIRGNAKDGQRIAFLANMVRTQLTEQFHQPVSRIYTARRVPQQKLPEVLHALVKSIACAQGASDDAMNLVRPDDFLNAYLSNIGIIISFNNNTQMVTISGQDAYNLLEVNAKLTGALPISVLMSAGSVSARLNPDTVRQLESIYSVKIGAFSGHSGFSGPVVPRRIIVGEKVTIETHEPDPAGLLSSWRRLQQLWDGPLPPCLRSPRRFAAIEDPRQAPPQSLAAAGAASGAPEPPRFDRSVPPPGMSTGGAAIAELELESLARVRRVKWSCGDDDPDADCGSS